MRRLKAFGERIASRDPNRQAAEIHARIALLNRFPALGQAEITRVVRTQGDRGRLGPSPSYATTPLRAVLPVLSLSESPGEDRMAAANAALHHQG